MKTIHYNLGNDPKNGSFKEHTACQKVLITKSTLEATKEQNLVTCKNCLSYLEKRTKLVTKVRTFCSEP